MFSLDYPAKTINRLIRNVTKYIFVIEAIFGIGLASIILFMGSSALVGGVKTGIATNSNSGVQSSMGYFGSWFLAGSLNFVFYLILTVLQVGWTLLVMFATRIVALTILMFVDACDDIHEMKEKISDMASSRSAASQTFVTSGATSYSASAKHPTGRSVDDWKCPKCGMKNSYFFRVCQCGARKPK